MGDLGDVEGNSLNICWVTVRKGSDLCSTTTLSLAKGLTDSGYNLTILNPDDTASYDEYAFSQHELHRSSTKGFQASSIAKSAQKWFESQSRQDFDMILVDWQLARKLIPFFKKKGWPMILMDRSPPADRSIFSKLQWREWRMAWKKVSSGDVVRGCVVSPAHQKFVMKHFPIPSERIHVLPAGVDLNRFKPNPKNKMEREIRMVYHGRLDKHRGIMALPMLVQKLRNTKIEATLTLIGEGNAVDDLKRMNDKCSWIKIHSQMRQEPLSEILADQHIGLLPMPGTKVWSLASPLKRSEYLASGLLVLGTKHEGHILENTQDSWFYLAEQHDFHENGIKWIQSLDEDKFNQGSRLSRQYAEKYCTWESAICELKIAIQSARIEE